MNLFRLIGDLLHTFAILFLPISIIHKKSYQGVSHRSQLLLFMVFVARYLDIMEYFVSYYNSFMKALFISATMITYLMGFFYTDIGKHDNFSSEILVFLAMMASILNYPRYPTLEVCWTFSEYLETLAIIPQVCMILRSKRISGTMIIYMTATVFYKIFYSFNWVYRYQYEGHLDPTSDIAGMTFIGIYGTALLLMLCSGVKRHDAIDRKMSRNNMFCRMTLSPAVFSISSNVIYGGQASPEDTPLVKENEVIEKEKDLAQREKELIQNI